MNHFSRSLLLAAGLLAFSQMLPAQDSIFVTPITASPLDIPGTDFYVPENNFYAGPSVYETLTPLNAGPVISSDSYSGPYASYSGSPTVSYAQGDADFVPSQYMNYKKAVALGDKMWNDENDPAARPSLGDVARAARASAQPIAPRPRHISVTQDNQGKMIVCKSDLKSCS